MNKPTIEINGKTFRDVISNIDKTLNELTLNKLSSLYLYSNNTEAIIISFNNNWEPFFGYTRGYNDMGNRCYLLQPLPQFYNNLIKYMSIFRDSICNGGRVFITDELCYFNDMTKQRSVICQLSLPKAKSFYGTVLTIYTEIMMKKRTCSMHPKCIEEYLSDPSFPQNLLGNTVIVNNEIGEIEELVNNNSRIKIRILNTKHIKTYQLDIILKNYRERES